MTSLPKSGIHIIGIGGAGMSAIARVLIGRGYQVSGSDAKDSKRLLMLKQLGIKVSVGHQAENLTGVKLVVASTAVPATNIEIATAKELNIPVISRAEALALIVADSKVIAVAGTHGKTTTTSMTTVALQSLGLDPSFIIGSELNETGSNGHHGESEIFLVEADESDGTFLWLKPQIGVITNIEADHLDRWESLNEIANAFYEFGMSCELGVVSCADDNGAAEIAMRLQQAGKQVFNYGFADSADLQLRNATVDDGKWKVDLYLHQEYVGALSLQVPGKHNLLNAAAAISVGILLNFELGELISGLAEFSGTRRRFEHRGTANGVKVYDDYAHHPTEVMATLSAARAVVGSGNVVVVFQPFRYYRVAAFLPQFAAALGLADRVVVMETYAPGESAIPGSGGAAVAAAIDLAPENVTFEPSFLKVVDLIAAWTKPGDIVLTLGAGDMAMLAPEIVAGLKQVEDEK
ncbi:MAG: UDP-N-acetylmuramate--L-alanine ligase [Candidatus Nanopelagicales bacterium]